jgi:oligoendopeptidase F
MKKSLTAADYNKKWHELNKTYFGEDMVIDEEIDIEWSRIPHFYSDFYVYQYATGYLLVLEKKRIYWFLKMVKQYQC